MTTKNRLRHDVNSSVPLVVDLDGTLTPIDTLHEAIIRFLFSKHIHALVCMCIWLFKGKAYFKNQISLLFTLDPTLTLWNKDVLVGSV